MGVWAWSDNVCGELGDGTTTSKLLPEPIGLTGVTKIAGGDTFLLQVSSAAIRSDGTLWTWGCDAFGQLGHSGSTGRVPRQVTNLAGVTAFACGGARVSAGSEGIDPGRDGPPAAARMPVTYPPSPGVQCLLCEASCARTSCTRFPNLVADKRNSHGQDAERRLFARRCRPASLSSAENGDSPRIRQHRQSPRQPRLTRLARRDGQVKTELAAAARPVPRFGMASPELDPVVPAGRGPSAPDACP